MLHADQSNRNYYIFLIIGIVFVAFNLRGGITSVGPLVGIIRDDINLSNWSVGLLTGLPLVAFALMSPIAPKIGRKLSNELTIILGMVILFIGISMRSISVVFLVFLGTLLVGFGIAICNVLLPSIIKANFPTKVALLTGVYSISMGTFAATASGISVPLAVNLNLGWQLALIVWTIPVLLCIAIWLFIFKQNNRKKKTTVQTMQNEKSGIWKSKLAWKIGLFMGFQSFIFYVLVSWLPEILNNFGMDIALAGFMLAYFQIIGLPASFILPIICGRMSSQSTLVVIVNAINLGGFILLLLNISFLTTVIAITLIGFSTNGNFAIALTFLGVRAKTAQHAAELSGMAQTIGYVIAASGPILIGYIFDVTNAWTIPLFILMGVLLIVIYFGIYAGKNRYVLD